MHVRENSLSLSLRVSALFIPFSILQAAFFDCLRAFRGNIRIIHRIIGFVVFLVSFRQMAKMANKGLKKKRKMLSIEHARGFTWGKIVVIDRARLFCLVSEFEARCGFEIGDQSLRGKREIFVENLGNDINALIL